MKWTHKQFGEMEFEEKHVVYFPNGIIGFEENKKFLIGNDELSEPFRWLISLEDDELSFPLLDPQLLSAVYKGKYFSADDVTVFVVVSIKPDVAQSTVNLRSPIVIDSASRIGKQVVLEDETLNVRASLAPLAETIMVNDP